MRKSCRVIAECQSRWNESTQGRSNEDVEQQRCWQAEPKTGRQAKTDEPETYGVPHKPGESEAQLVNRVDANARAAVRARAVPAGADLWPWNLRRTGRAQRTNRTDRVFQATPKKEETQESFDPLRLCGPWSRCPQPPTTNYQLL